MDGGYTGCSLSLVSKSIRNASRAGRFNCVMLRSSSAEQVAQFLNCFKAERARAVSAGGSLPTIRHLFLASAKRQVNLRLYDRILLSPDTELEEFQANVSSLLDLVAPDLSTLFLLDEHHKWDEILRLPNLKSIAAYTNLQELYVFGYELVPYEPPRALEEDLSFEAHRVDHSAPFTHPRLTHLHFTFYSSSFVPLHLWAACAPNITHIHLRNMSYSGSNAVDVIRTATTSVTCGESLKCVQRCAACRLTPSCVVQGSDSDDGATRKATFERLEVLIVQPSTSPPIGFCGTPRIRYRQFIRQLGEVHSEKTATRRWALLPPMSKPSRKTIANLAVREWRDWQRGRAGSWAVNKSYLNDAAK